LASTEPPDWTLAQLLGWLHGVLRFVVREERARASARLETQAAQEELSAYRDPRPDQLQNVIDAQSRAIVHECLMQLNGDQRAAWLLRLQGARYEEIARRLGVNENTVATWLRRGTQELVRRVQEQIDPRGAVPRVAKVFHG
jgi:RNA polymerase sigma factor (sigma-70 family)